MLDIRTIEKLALERINELNKELYIVDLNISANNIISLELDRVVGSVSVEDCISVSRNIEHNLDRELLDFELNVSSAGLDRPLRHQHQFNKNIGKTLEVLLNNGVLITGILERYSDEEIDLKTEKLVKVEGKKKKQKVEEIINKKFEEIKEVKVKISFK